MIMRAATLSLSRSRSISSKSSATTGWYHDVLSLSLPSFQRRWCWWWRALLSPTSISANPRRWTTIPISRGSCASACARAAALHDDATAAAAQPATAGCCTSPSPSACSACPRAGAAAATSSGAAAATTAAACWPHLRGWKDHYIKHRQYYYYYRS
jgi:hypothetical protein